MVFIHGLADYDPFACQCLFFLADVRDLIYLTKTA